MSAKTRPEWADKLERLRGKLGISQAGLAKRLHVSAMAPSRWERGINEPPAEIYIQLGKMVGEPACWYFWEKAGLKKSDVLAAVTNKSKPRSAEKTGPRPPSAVQVIPSSKLKNARATTPMVAIPLYAVMHHSEPVLNKQQAEEVVIAPQSWCEHPDTTFCLRYSGDRMRPVLRDGAVVAIDELQTDRSKLDGKIVLACHPQKGFVIHHFQRTGKTELLVPENRDYPPIYLAEGGWTILGKAVWWLERAP